MNILILAASPRTGSTYLQDVLIPEKYFEDFSYTPEGRDKMWLTSPPELDHTMHVSPYGEIHLYGEHWAMTDKDTLYAEWNWWYKIDPENTLRVVKVFPEHIIRKGIKDINYLLNITDKVYLLFRKDYTAVVYSILAAEKTNNWSSDRSEETIKITKPEFDAMAEKVYHSYNDALSFLNSYRGKVEVVCLEEDLPSKPYKQVYTFNNPQFEVDTKFRAFYNKFRRLGLNADVRQRFTKR
jgi:hypothetical protein